MARKRKNIIFGGIIFLIIILIGITTHLVRLGFKAQGPLMFLPYLESPVVLQAPQYEYTTTDVNWIVDGQRVRGTVFIPKTRRLQKPLVIYSHGFNCQCELLKNKARSLAAAGVAVLVYDFRGGSLRGQSEGNMRRMTVNTEQQDLESALSLVRTWRWVDKGRIFLMGESFGGLVSGLVASKHSELRGVVLCFPALMSSENARRNFKSDGAVPDSIVVGDMVTGKSFWQALRHIDIYKELSKYTGRVLILHGLKDKMVDPSCSVRANRVYHHSELFLIEDSGHGFGGDDNRSTLNTIYQFVMK